MAVESASVRRQQKAIPPILHSPFRQRLHENFISWRAVVSLLTILGPLIHSMYGEWSFIGAVGEIHADARVIIFVLTLYPASLLAAIAFPVTITSQAGASFVFVPAVIAPVLRCFGVCLDLVHTATHVNVACTIVHVAAAAVVFSAWLWAAVLGLRRSYTWRAVRLVFATDGAALLLCNLLLRTLGPPPSYTPGGMSFPAALARGGAAIVLGAILTPGFRQRLADLANRAGVNHVTIRLNELSVSAAAARTDLLATASVGTRGQAARQQQPLAEHAEMREADSSEIELSTLNDRSPQQPRSNQTATKVGGPMVFEHFEETTWQAEAAGAAPGRR